MPYRGRVGARRIYKTTLFSLFFFFVFWEGFGRHCGIISELKIDEKRSKRVLIFRLFFLWLLGGLLA